ncbi:uncharacterized protein LOC122198186 isoform X2 [Lactuca sativa]|uniref:uncharacterized protein LOC122198186 isoform X2 n=1 Tax=Lactuca sativa TaxID=4236 RepID=UPI0022AF736A|nr:uncharacterized protein LOC122198186 isoform X2 [Lactuca sativa]
MQKSQASLNKDVNEVFFRIMHNTQLKKFMNEYSDKWSKLLMRLAEDVNILFVKIFAQETTSQLFSDSLVDGHGQSQNHGQNDSAQKSPFTHQPSPGTLDDWGKVKA